MEIRTIKKTECSMEELQQIIREGKAPQLLPVGTQLMIKFDGKLVPYDVIGINAERLVNSDLKNSITIQAYVLQEERPFDTTDRWGSNAWETSELRHYLNSEEYAARYEELVPYLAAVYKKNNDNESTVDTFFLLSIEEYGADERVETQYKFYEGKGEIVRVKANKNGITDWHWTRSEVEYNTRYIVTVSPYGDVNNDYNMRANRFAPACVIA
jgi:hypothetical protein